MTAFRRTAFVIDRATAPSVRESVRALGGAWMEMFDTWERVEVMPYLVMMAHTKERVTKRAPLTAMARDEEGLRLALRTMCRELSDVTCAWIHAVEPGGVAEQILREELLADTVPRGSA